MSKENNKNEDNEFEAAYSESGFWDKLRGYAKKAGQEVVEKALLLYYAAQEENAPAWAKATIAAALGYFIVPLDAVADIVPMIGYADDLGVLALAVTTVAMYINDNVRQKTADKMLSWFGSDDNKDDMEGVIEGDIEGEATLVDIETTAGTNEKPESGMG